MPLDHRVHEMLTEILDSGNSPEFVSRSCPGLLPQLLVQLRRVRALEQEVVALFPPPVVLLNTIREPSRTPNELPQIPGYAIESVHGQGGMGVVYSGRHLSLNRPVAIKMLLAGSYATATERERFKREAKAAAHLQHPNMVQVFDVADHNGTLYFTMEFVDGGTLSDHLAGAPLPPKKAAELMILLSDAVFSAHEAGIIHRDLKPSNILLTSAGTPKITDFGLARQLEGAADLTMSGTPIGTPSYMSPEQARGGASARKASVDIYALGALLYELLTGRPPFRAESSSATLQQVLTQEPVPPKRLNANVPRDLETICLKCLQKDPGRRFASAADLRNDLQRWLRNEPIVARRVGSLERTLRWTQRKPTAAALIATALALIALTIGGGVRALKQLAERRAELRSEVGMAVVQAENLRKGFHFQEARALLQQAQHRLKPTGPDDLRRHVDEAQADLELVENLDTARLQAAILVGGISGSGKADQLYEEIMTSAGLGRLGEDSDVVAERVRALSVHAEIVTALEDWAGTTLDESRRTWLLAVVRAADPDPIRERLRQPQLWHDAPALTRLAQELRIDEQPPQLLTILGRVLRANGGDAVPLLIAAQEHHPEDFWLNFELGGALFGARRYEEALGFYRAALALRPTSSLTYNAVGTSLAMLERRDEAIGYLQQAVNLNRNNAVAHHSLGRALSVTGRLDEAIGHYQESIRLRPGVSLSHFDLGNALRDKGCLDEAIGHFQESIRLQPNAPLAHLHLALAFQAKGRPEDAFVQFQESIRLDPKSAVAHYNLGHALRGKGRLDEAMDHFRESIEIDPKVSAFHYSIGVALRDSGRLAEAFSYLQQAVELESGSPTVNRDNLYSCLYAAACVAVRVSAGEGSPEALLPEEERAGLRGQAIQWLRASLELRAQLLKEGKAVSWSLAAWQTNPGLVSVRDPAALTKLPGGEREQWNHLWAHVGALLAADPAVHGRKQAARRDWAGAADFYGRALGQGATNEGHFWFEYAAVLLLSGDRDGYSVACARMVDQCGKVPGLRAYHVARTCTLTPNSVSDPALPGRLAESELKSAAKQFWSLTQQGALHYRAGRFEQAVSLFEQSLSADPAPGKAVVNWLWLSMAQQRLSKPEEARRWLDKATTWLDQYREGMPDRAEIELGLHLHNWLEAHVLRGEAEALIGPAEKR